MLHIRVRLSASALADTGTADDLIGPAGTSLLTEPIAATPIIATTLYLWRTPMKPLVICTAILGLAFACPAAEAKGCIKGAIVGGIAGHLAGHGKVGAVAGCIIGHHEANKQDANRAERKPPPSTHQDNRI
jgi:uncharacterized protein YcfJ